MKKIIAVILAALMAVPFVFGLTACGSSDDIDWNGLNIGNFSSYTALGAAVVGSGGVKTSSFTTGDVPVAYADGEGVKLVGRKSDGSYEIVAFTDEKGKTVEQSLELAAIRSFKHFTFLAYAYPDVKVDSVEVLNSRNSSITTFNNIASFCDFDKNGKLNYNTYRYFIVDNEGGKIFDVADAMAGMTGDDSEYVGGVFNAYVENGDYGYINYEASANKDGVSAIDYGGYYRMSVKNGRLEMARVLPATKYEDFFGAVCRYGENVFADNYGNIYSNLNVVDECSNVESAERAQYILKTDGTVSALKISNEDPTERYINAMDGYVYHITETETKRFNAKGEEEVSEFTPPSDIYVDDNALNYSDDQKCLLFEKDNTKYFFSIRAGRFELPGYRDFRTIHKFTFSGDGYAYERVELEGTGKEYIFANGKLYFLSNEQILYCNIDTGASTVLASDYKFKTMTAGADGKLYFTGVNENLDDIYGVISADDKVTLNVNDFVNNMQVVYINALN